MNVTVEIRIRCEDGVGGVLAEVSTSEHRTGLGNPQFDDPEIRQAIAVAADRVVPAVRQAAGRVPAPADAPKSLQDFLLDEIARDERKAQR